MDQSDLLSSQPFGNFPFARFVSSSSGGSLCGNSIRGEITWHGFAVIDFYSWKFLWYWNEGENRNVKKGFEGNLSSLAGRSPHLHIKHPKRAKILPRRIKVLLLQGRKARATPFHDDGRIKSCKRSRRRQEIYSNLDGKSWGKLNAADYANWPIK